MRAPTMATHKALIGSSSNAMSNGSKPAKYVPTTGTNCDSTPTHIASGSGNGTPMMAKAAQCTKNAAIASSVLE